MLVCTYTVARRVERFVIFSPIFFLCAECKLKVTSEVPPPKEVCVPLLNGFITPNGFVAPHRWVGGLGEDYLRTLR